MTEGKACKVGQEYLLESFPHFRNGLYRNTTPHMKHFQGKKWKRSWQQFPDALLWAT